MANVFDRVDTRLFKAFLSAAETKSFTQAAVTAGMTQSGVSQHIAKLEEQVGVPLFERVNKKVLLTTEGEEFRRFIETYADTLDSFVDRVGTQKSTPKGPVRYAMPASCLKTPHFSILLEKRKAFPEIEIKVEISANDEIFEKLIAGEIDFGFVTKGSNNPVVRHEQFAAEEYTLVSADRALVKQIDSQNLATTPFIFYPGMDVLLDFWRQRYFPQKKNFNSHSMLRKGEINHLDGAITMVRNNLGCGVFPKHCVEEYLKSKELHAFKSTEKNDPIEKIYIVTRENHNLPSRVQTVLDAFWAMKK